MNRHLAASLVISAWIGLVAAAWSTSEAQSDSGPSTGGVTGTVTYHGKVPKAPFPDDLGIERPLLSVDAKGESLQYAVVYLEPADESTKTVVNDVAPGDKPTSPNREGSETAAAAPKVLVDQRDMTFVPHLIAVREGQTVRFANSDAANHNVRSAALDRRNQFNVITPLEGSYERAFFADPKQRPIRLGCEIHAWMRAWIYVFDHPYFAVTDAKGRYAIASAPPGNYVVKLRQPDVGLHAERAITVAADQPTSVDFRFTEEDLDLP